ncbi:MAG: hypothetical protein OXD31_02065 [Chloroflexi bacterium]|nr:hypothetical protein [Chloroflexota bacterium]
MITLWLCIRSSRPNNLSQNAGRQAQPDELLVRGSDLTTLYATTGGGDVYMASIGRQGRLHYPSV